MSKVSFIFRTDLHLSDHPPVSWKGDYQGELWSDISQIGEYAKEHSCQAVLDGGDYFHVKAATRNSHSLVFNTAQHHSGYPCPVWSVEGNHDLKHNNLETISQQPLGVLYASGVFRKLRDTTFTSEDSSVTVRVVGVPYSPCRTLDDLRSIRKGSEDHLVAVVHALATDNPPEQIEDFWGEPVFKYADLDYEGSPDVYCFGHWHKDQGVTEINGRYFVNPGSVSRGALVRDSLSRIPQVVLLSFDAGGIDIKSLPLDVLPASEVFDLERKQREESESKNIEEFVSLIPGTLDGSLGEELPDVETALESFSFAREIKELALSYFEQARNK